MLRTARFGLSLALLAGLTIACSDDPTGPEQNPLSGLSLRTANDSLGNPLPPAPATPTPGVFRGFVLAPCAGSCTGDTLATSPRISGVVVKAYQITGGSAANPTLGPVAATVTTGNDGTFTLPQLAGGEYVVTFTPPSSSNYAGVWVTAHTSTQSDDYPWWVILPIK